MLTDYFGLYRSGEVMKPKLQTNTYDTSSGSWRKAWATERWQKRLELPSDTSSGSGWSTGMTVGHLQEAWMTSQPCHLRK